MNKICLSPQKYAQVTEKTLGKFLYKRQFALEVYNWQMSHGSGILWAD